MLGAAHLLVLTLGTPSLAFAPLSPSLTEVRAATTWLGRAPSMPRRSVKAFLRLHEQAPELDPLVLERALVAAYTARRVGFGRRRPFLTVIDHALPSDARRMWIFDLRKRTLVRRERVAHGEGSGGARPRRWSNGLDSRASSLGLFVTRETYRGRRGRSLRLIGLDPGFNDGAYGRSIVIHGAAYMTETYRNTHGGEFGRSHGCPALDPAVSREVIDTLKGGSLVFVHGPDPGWLRSSPWLQARVPKGLRSWPGRRPTEPTRVAAQGAEPTKGSPPGSHSELSSAAPGT